MTQLRRTVAASAFALGLGRGALPCWAQEVQSPLCCTPADLADFAAADAIIRPVNVRAEAAQTMNNQDAMRALWEAWQLSEVADAELLVQPVEVTRSVTAWKPALAAALETCSKHLVHDMEFEPLFAVSCSAVQAQYRQATEVVGYVLAKRAAAADLAPIARAGAGRKAAP